MELLKGSLHPPIYIISDYMHPFPVKLQLQLQKLSSDRQFRGPIDCAKQVVRAQGIQGLWTGFTGSLVFRSNFFWMFVSFEVGFMTLTCGNCANGSCRP